MASPGLIYQADIGVVAAGAGYAAEITGAANKLIYVKEIVVSKPTAEVVVRFIRASTAATGGTSSNPTKIGINTNASANLAVATVTTFTGAPTAGTAIGDILDITVATGDTLTYTFGETDDYLSGLLLNGTAQALGINVSAAATIKGHIKWMEVV